MENKGIVLKEKNKNVVSKVGRDKKVGKLLPSKMLMKWRKMMT